MVELLRRLRLWLGSPGGDARPGVPAQHDSAKDFVELNRDVPLKSAARQHAFVRREAILDRAEKVAGYEFSLVSQLESRVSEHGPVAARAYDSALLARLALDGVNSLLGSRLAFVSLSAMSIDNESIARLPAENTVLVFDEVSPTAELAASMRALKARGFAVGVRIRAAAGAESALMNPADYFVIDVPPFDGIDLRSLTRRLKQVQPGGPPPPHLVAREVQSYDDYRFCFKSGFDYFLGPFISSRESLRPTHDGVNRVVLLPILKLVLADESFSVIADRLKNEPVLTYKLLRYLNSAALGLGHRIDNLTQAIVILGRQKFHRWMSLLLFDFSHPGYAERVLAERALTRGRTLELLAGAGRIPAAPDNLFLIGLFSLLDQALGQPLPQLVERAALPDAVRDALLGKAGPYADALALIVLGEANATASAEQLAHAFAACAIGDEVYAPAARAALVWANQVLGDVAA